MNQVVTCNACQKMFNVEPKDIVTTRDGDLEVQYFSCQWCFKKYLVLATDGEMRDLIAQYKQVAMKMRAAHLGKFREKEIRKYERELAEIKKKQEQKLPELKRLGLECLERSAGHAPEQ